MAETTNSYGKWTYPEGREWIGVLVTLAFVIGAIYLLFKFGKTQGFWWGVFAMALLSSYMITKSNYTVLSTPLLSVSNKPSDVVPPTENTPT